MTTKIFIQKYHSSLSNKINTKITIHLSLIIIIAFLLVFEIPFNSHDITYAGQIKNETIDNRVIVEVTLKLEGKTIPGKPQLVSAENTLDALYEKTTGTELELKKTADNTWTCHAEEGQKYVIGWIAKKGWFEKRSKMFGYCSEPFTANKDLTVTFSPGMPATFEYDLSHPPKGVMATPAEVSLQKKIIKDGKKTFHEWGGSQEIKKPGILRITRLAAGNYKISAQTSDKAKHQNSRIPILCENREIKIKPGTVNRFDPNYPEIDSTVEKGDVTIRGTLYGPDKKPLANKIVHVIPVTNNLHLYYPPSTTDSNGRFEFFGIRPNKLVYVSYENTSVNLGKLSLVENAVVSVDIVLGLKKLPVVIGEPIEEIIVDWREGKTGRLLDLEGKIVVLDVWATWCLPCIRALPELNSLATEISNDHDVVFVALSTDSDEAVWKKMLDEDGWNALKHGRLDQKKNAFVFNRQIPYSMILDKDGAVLAEGNGLDIRLELKKLGKTYEQPSADNLEESPKN